jgi:hypothetical protein
MPSAGPPRIYNSQILAESGIAWHPARRTMSGKILSTAFRWDTGTNVLGIILAYVCLVPNLAQGQQSMLILPTENQGLLRGDPASFYQYVQRDFEGQVSQAWEGGEYGFVRNPRRFGSAIIFTRFHEGIDIRPLNRDAGGEPTDVIHAIAAGKVAYTNSVAGYSNYGKYVVVEHTFDNCPS